MYDCVSSQFLFLRGSAQINFLTLATRQIFLCFGGGRVIFPATDRFVCDVAVAAAVAAAVVAISAVAVAVIVAVGATVAVVVIVGAAAGVVSSTNSNWEGWAPFDIV